ncbi:MAG: lysophospholipase L1-like esterase [Arcticibacterium sp.]|jgi:lysophospholipase L1-like esterase
MKMTLKDLGIIIILVIFISCDKDNLTPKIQSNSLNKIMSLGGSRVEGNRPAYESFRYELWKDLIENSWTFDYIGTQTDQASYPMFNDRSFDLDHEGRAGWTSGQILDGLNDWLAETGVPDIVLFSSPGGNDALEGLPYNQAIANINGIVNALQNANPNVTIIIEQLAPARSDLMTIELTTYFNRLKQDIPAITSDNSTTSSEVIALDMFSDFTDSLLVDDVHYNEAGAGFIASRYYRVLKNILEEE